MGKSKDGQETSVKITTVSIFSVKVTQGFDTQVCVCAVFDNACCSFSSYLSQVLIMLFNQETIERIIQYHLFLLRIYRDFTVVIKI